MERKTAGDVLVIGTGTAGVTQGRHGLLHGADGHDECISTGTTCIPAARTTWSSSSPPPTSPSRSANCSQTSPRPSAPCACPLG